MFLIRLCLFVCVNLFLYTKCSIPVEKLCVNPTCEEPISKAQGKVTYTPPSRDVLGFDKGEEIIIISKSKNKEDYWGAVIKGKSGYVPSSLVKEVKIFHAEDDLKPVTVTAAQPAFVDEQKSVENNTSDHAHTEEIKSGNSNAMQPKESVGATPSSPKPLLALESTIEPKESFKIIEGTTIYSDETDEIKPSPTTNVKSAGQTIDPTTSNINRKPDTERATVPPEIINLNSNYQGQDKQNKTTFTIENVKKNDGNAIVESRDIDDGDDDDYDDNDGNDDDEEEDEGGNDDEGDLTGDNSPDEMNKNLDNQVVKNEFYGGKESSGLSQSAYSFLRSTEKNNDVVDAVKNFITSGVSGSTDDSRIETESLPQPSQQNVGENKIDKLSPSHLPQQPAEGDFQRITMGPPEPKAASPSGNNNAVPAESQVMLPNYQAIPPKENIKNEASAMGQSVASGASREMSASQELTAEVSIPTSRNTAEGISEILHSITVPATEEGPGETLRSASSQPISSETSAIFSQFSVSADSLPEKSSNNDQKPSPEMMQEKMESKIETFATSQLISTEAHQFTESTQTWLLNPSDKAPPEITQETVKEVAEPTAAPSPLPQETKEDFNFFDDLRAPDAGSKEQGVPSDEKMSEESTLPLLTGMFSSWFTSVPSKEESSAEEEVNFEGVFAETQSEKRQKQIPDELASGKCGNDGFGLDCAELAPEEEPSSFWNSWIVSGSAMESFLTSSNTFAYLVVTAVTVLLFTLGHNWIEKRGKTGPLIAKINKLEHELLVSSRECLMLKDEIHSLKEKIVLYENSANDELVLSLQAELEESKKVKSELESSIEILQQELDAATEAGLDLNKMLSEVLTQKGGSESLLKSVESLQAQLDCQQKVIDEMTKKLGVKNEENEALQTALEAANYKSESLEEQLGDMKHNLNLHLKEKEDLTRDLNSQIHQLKIRINQLGESKEREISKLKKELDDLRKKFSESVSGLTVKEEEVKALRESMKQLKGKGDVKLETVFDVSRLKGELAKEVKEKLTLMERLEKEESGKKDLADQMKTLDSEMQKLKKGYEEAEQKKDEAEKKLEVLSTYFKEKETQLQKELGLQEALWAQKKGDEKAVYNIMKSLQEEVESYKSQNETLKKEILDQERGLKNQIAVLEQKAHENWVAARQAERKLEESKQEMAQLRNRLTLIEKNSSNAEGKGNLRSSEELNGAEAASPILHDTSSPLLFPPLPLDPNGSSLLPPGFMPPPMFIPPPIGGFIPPPPFLPGDRRPPPLGRMSSPPLNSRFSPSSPADYPFERMSSPPLSPPDTNYRSSNEDRDHYRHRTPSYPPPLHLRNWDDGNEMPGFIPISSQRDSRRDHKGSNVSSEHSSSESLDKSSRHSGRV